MSRRNKGIVWSIFFLLLFALSLDYWRWDEPVELISLNLPGWTFGFDPIVPVILLASLIIGLGILSRPRRIERRRIGGPPTDGSPYL